MAKTLTEQARIWSPSGSDPAQFGDGAPMHSAIPFDLMRWLNNLQTYCEPTFQFAYDVSAPLGAGGGAARCRFQAPAGTTSGVCMLAQLPILVPIQAPRLAWHLGIYRYPFGAETAVAMNVSDVTVYLAAGPCVNLRDPIADNPAPQERARLFDPSYIQGAYTSNSVVAAATSDDASSGPIFKLITNDNTFGTAATWTNFANDQNINDRTKNPWAYAIVTATFDTADTGEAVALADFSIWGDHGT